MVAIEIDGMWRFRQMIKAIAASNHLSGYELKINVERDTVAFINREKTIEITQLEDAQLKLRPESYERAKRAAPGHDIYYLEQQWREYWANKGKPELGTPDGAFTGFCSNRNESTI